MIQKKYVSAALAAGILIYPVQAQDAPAAETQTAESSKDEAKDAAPPPPPINIRAAPPAPPAPPIAIPPPAPVASPPPPPPSRPVTELMGGEEKLNWFQSPALFFPGRIELGEAQITEDSLVFEAPLSWAVSGRITQAVEIKVDGKGAEIPAGTVLPQVMLRTPTGTDSRYTLFCTRSKTVQEASNDFIRNMFGGLVDGLRDAQWCLQDSDDDGLLDLAVVLNAGAPITKAADITPVPVEELLGEPIEGDGDKLNVRLTRVGRNTIQLQLNVSQDGSDMQFQTLRSGRHRATKFSSFRYGDGESNRGFVLGLRFDLIDANRRENWAQLRWSPVIRSEYDFVVIPTRVSIY